MNIRQKLNTLKKAKKYADLEAIFANSKLDEREYWLLKYCFVKNLMVENICARLNLSRPYYHIIKNIALTKVEFANPDL